MVLMDLVVVVVVVVLGLMGSISRVGGLGGGRNLEGPYHPFQRPTSTPDGSTSTAMKMEAIA
jgi:hypothetical protein